MSGSPQTTPPAPWCGAAFRRRGKVPPVEVRAIRPSEYPEAGAIVVAAYRALPGAHLSNGYARDLADIGRRATEAEVLVAVDGRVLGCVTFVPDAASPWAEMLEGNEAAIRMLGVDPAVQKRGAGRAL